MNSHKMLTEQERQEVTEGLKIPKGGYKFWEKMIREQLEEKIDDEGFRILDIFPERVFFQTENGIFEAKYLAEGDSVKLSEIVKLNETLDRLEERLRGAMKKKLYELKMAGLSPKSDKRRLLVEQGSVANERTLTERQVKDRRIAGLS